MSENILSQDEISALLQGMDSGAVPAGAGPVATGEAIPYDLVGNDRIVRGRLPTLEMINERFARQWRNSLYGMLHRSVAVTARGVEMARFSEYMHSLPTPGNINLVRIKQLRGTALVVLHPSLVFTVVDNFFGGGGRFPARLEGREFTATEMRVIHLLLQQVFTDLAEACAPALALEFEYMNSETNPHFANILTPREYIVVSRFQVELEGGSGEMHVGLPWAMLEPVRDALGASVQGDSDERDEKWSRALRHRLFDTDVQPLAVLAEIRTSVGKLLRMKEGDVLPIDIKDPLPLLVEGVPVFRGHFGVANGKHAVKITDILRKSPQDGDHPPASAS